MEKPAHSTNNGLVEIVLVLVIAVITAGILFLLVPVKPKDLPSNRKVLGEEAEQSPSEAKATVTPTKIPESIYRPLD